MIRALTLVLTLALAACSSKPPAEAVDIEGNWAFAKGQLDGSPLFVRINRGVASLTGDARYTHRAGVAVPLLLPTADGLPGEEEAKQLIEIELALTAALEPRQVSVPVLVITTKGMREFVFYTSDPTTFEPAVQRVRTSITHHTLQTYVEADPTWSVYLQFSADSR